MRTDALLIARRGVELQRRFQAARVRDAGLLEDGRFAIALWKKGRTELLCADLFSSTPVLTVESTELPVAAEPGFVRAAVQALSGKTIAGIAAMPGERMIRIEFGSASRFGVAHEYTLLYELVPRFGNILLLKDNVVVAALKEFHSSAARTIARGRTYEPPPARVNKLLVAGTADESVENDLYVYRDDRGALLQAYLVPLENLASASCERSPSLLDLFSELRASAPPAPTGGSEKTREDALKRIDSRQQKLHAEIVRVEQRLTDLAQRDGLRLEGERIYAQLHELEAHERAPAKQRAVEVFAEYKKAAAGVQHAERRRRSLRQSLADLETIRWEIERAPADRIAEVTEALLPRRQSAAPKRRAVARKRTPSFSTAAGSRILFGRSPIENAELTFHVARPDDLWFHARGQPGAHVILQRDDRRDPPDEDLQAAAALAAFHSKGRASAKVAVDYTKRKHVRKRPDAAPGLVTYGSAQTIVVEPRDLQ